MRRRVPPSSRRSRMGGVPQSLFLLSLSLTFLTFSTPSYLPVINPPPSSHNLSCDLLSERVQPECATSSSAASAPAKQSARGVANILNKQPSGDTICNQHQLAVSSATVCPDTPHQRGLLCRPPARQRALHQQLHRSLGAYTHVRAIGSWVDASNGR